MKKLALLGIVAVMSMACEAQSIPSSMYDPSGTNVASGGEQYCTDACETQALDAQAGRSPVAVDTTAVALDTLAATLHAAAVVTHDVARSERR